MTFKRHCQVIATKHFSPNLGTGFDSLLRNNPPELKIRPALMKKKKSDQPKLKISKDRQGGTDWFKQAAGLGSDTARN